MNVGGAGAIDCSARDMAQWPRLQLNDGVYDGKRLIAPATLAETRSGQIVPRSGHGTATATLKDGALTISRPTAAAVLLHDRGDRFRTRWTSASLLSVFGETPVGFTIGPVGQITSLELGPDRFTRESRAGELPPRRASRAARPVRINENLTRRV